MNDMYICTRGRFVQTTSNIFMTLAEFAWTHEQEKKP